MTNPRTGVLVKFPADLLRDLDLEAQACGLSRMAVIIARCLAASPARPAVTSIQDEAAQANRARAVAQAKVKRRAALTAEIVTAKASDSLPLGPVSRPPGSMLKKDRHR